MTDLGNYYPAGYCPSCDYPMDAGRCPECGEIAHVHELRSHPKRFQRLRFVPILLLVALICWPIVKSFRDRPLRIIPTTALFAQADAAANKEIWARVKNGSLSYKHLRRFSRNAFLSKTAFTERPSHPAGVPIELRTDLNPRIGNEDCYLTAGAVSCIVDGREVNCESKQEGFFSLCRIRYCLPPLDEGVHTVKVSQRFNWEGSGGMLCGEYTWRERRTQQIEVRGRLSDYASAVYSSALAREMHDAITATLRYSTSASRGWGNGLHGIYPWVVIDFKCPPVGMAGKLAIRYGSEDWLPLHDSVVFGPPLDYWSIAED